jgi:hypothetical protein
MNSKPFAKALMRLFQGMILHHLYLKANAKAAPELEMPAP